MKIEALRLDLQFFGYESWSLRWSVDGLCRVTLMVVWHCVSDLVASFVAAVDLYG